jgi:hypothetical protein
VNSSDLDLSHFENLRSKINARLTSIGTKHAYRQINEFPWLYGAVGQVPSEVMFICENPSLTGVERADSRTILGGEASIEDQWAGGPSSNCIKRFRPALCHLQLKTTPPTASGGWRCYITNVIKEADVVRDFIARDKKSLALEWADVLRWEIEQVSPRTIFTLGDAATKLVKLVQSRGLIPASPSPHRVMHYSNRGAGATDIAVREAIVRDITAGLAGSNRPY